MAILKYKIISSMTSLISKYVIKEYIIIGVLAYVAGYVFHSYKETPFEAVNRFGEVVYVIHPKGNTYFCPLYCATDHIHSAHNTEYICNRDTICSHYIYKNFKKDKTWQSKVKE